MADDTDDIRDEIDAKYEDVQEGTLYDVLEVESDADSSEISDQFRELAKKWHADRFKGHDLDPEYEQKVQEISTEINNAHRTLGNPEQRESYDASLETDPSEISSVIDAESAFRRGRNLLDAGRNEGAHEHFQRAVEMSPDEEPEYEAHLKYTEYLLIPKNSKGKPRDRAEAEELYEALEEIAEQFSDPKDWLLAYLGVVALGLDKSNRAENLFREALRYNSDNRLAQRQLRLIEMRRDDDDEGILSTILSKLNLK